MQNEAAVEIEGEIDEEDIKCPVSTTQPTKNENDCK